MIRSNLEALLFYLIDTLVLPMTKLGRAVDEGFTSFLYFPPFILSFFRVITYLQFFVSFES